MLKLSCSTYPYLQWTTDDAIRSISRCGFKGVEMLTPMHEIYHISPDLPAQRIVEIADILDLEGLVVSCISPANDILSPQTGSLEKETALLKANIDLAEIMNAPCVRPFATNQLPSGMSREEGLNIIIKVLRECVEYAEARRIKIALENHGIFPSVPKNIIDIVKGVDSPYMGVCLHVGRPGIDEIIDAVGRSIFHLHLGDCKPLSPEAERLSQEMRKLVSEGLSTEQAAAKLGFSSYSEAIEKIRPEVAPLGEGSLGLRGLVKKLLDVGYKGWWNLEVYPIQNPEPIATKSVENLTKVLEEFGVK